MPIEYANKPKQSQLMTVLTQAQNAQDDVAARPLVDVYNPAAQLDTQALRSESQARNEQQGQVQQETNKTIDDVKLDTTAWDKKTTSAKESTKRDMKGVPKQASFGLADAPEVAPAQAATNALKNATTATTTPVKKVKAAPTSVLKTPPVGSTLDELLLGAMPEYGIDENAVKTHTSELAKELSKMGDDEIARMQVTADTVTKKLLDQAMKLKDSFNVGDVGNAATDQMQTLSQSPNIGIMNALGVDSNNPIMNALNSQAYQGDIQNIKKQALQNVQDRGAALGNFRVATSGLRSDLMKGAKDITDVTSAEKEKVSALMTDDAKEAEDYVKQTSTDLIQELTARDTKDTLDRTRQKVKELAVNDFSVETNPEAKAAALDAQVQKLTGTLFKAKQKHGANSDIAQGIEAKLNQAVNFRDSNVAQRIAEENARKQRILLAKQNLDEMASQLARDELRWSPGSREAYLDRYYQLMSQYKQDVGEDYISPLEQSQLDDIKLTEARLKNEQDYYNGIDWGDRST